MKTITVPIINETYTIEEPEDWPIPLSSEEIDNLPHINDVDDEYIGWVEGLADDISHITKNKILHNENGPAQYITDISFEMIKWYINKKLLKKIEVRKNVVVNHFLNESNLISIVYRYNNSYEIIHKKGSILHRKSGPAKITMKYNELSLEYYINGINIKELNYKIK